VTEKLRDYFTQFVMEELQGRLGGSWKATLGKRNPFVVFALEEGSRTYFIAFYWQPRSVRFFVEIGWKPTTDRSIPTAKSGETTPDAVDYDQSAFAIRLFWLCNQGRSEYFWDLYSTEVWDRQKESFAEFKSRNVFDSVDEEIKVLGEGGPSDDYASLKAKLVGGDVELCLLQFALPFFERVRERIRA
jgi:hypothetical protein